MYMADFVGKGKVKPEPGSGICEFLIDANELGVEDSAIQGI